MVEKQCFIWVIYIFNYFILWSSKPDVIDSKVMVCDKKMQVSIKIKYPKEPINVTKLQIIFSAFYCSWEKHLNWLINAMPFLKKNEQKTVEFSKGMIQHFSIMTLDKIIGLTYFFLK